MNEKRTTIEMQRWKDKNKQTYKKKYLITFNINNQKTHGTMSQAKSKIYQLFGYDINTANVLAQLNDIPENSVLIRTDHDDYSIIKQYICNDSNYDISNICIYDILTICDFSLA